MEGRTVNQADADCSCRADDRAGFFFFFFPKVRECSGMRTMDDREDGSQTGRDGGQRRAWEGGGRYCCYCCCCLFVRQTDGEQGRAHNAGQTTLHSSKSLFSLYLSAPCPAPPHGRRCCVPLLPGNTPSGAHPDHTAQGQRDKMRRRAQRGRTETWSGRVAGCGKGGAIVAFARPLSSLDLFTTSLFSCPSHPHLIAIPTPTSSRLFPFSNPL